MKNRQLSILKFLIIVMASVTLFLAAASLAVFTYKNTQKPIPQQVFTNKETGTQETVAPVKPTEEPKIFAPKKKTNILILGTDQSEGLSDVILACVFDRDTKEINILNIPRDTYKVLLPETVAKIKSNGYGSPDHSKINEVLGMTDSKDVTYSKNEIEDLLKVKFDYYAVINTSAFRKIVDAVGGIRMTLTRNYYYYDPTQNLLIDLDAGDQVLDGKHAEMLVRYRHDYANGDLQRIEMQRTFMKAFFSQALNKEKIMNNLPEFISTMLTYVKTNFGVEDIPKFASSISELNPENIHFFDMPGEAERLDLWYFMVDEKEMAKTVNEVFYQTDAQQQEKALKIQLLDGSGNKTLMQAKQEQLKMNGFEVTDTATYTGKKQERTRIMVRNETDANTVKKFFLNPEVKIDTKLPEEYGMVIILGTQEK